MKKLITTIVASLGVLAAGIAFAGGPAAMMPPPASPFPEWYVGAGPSWNSIFNVESVESTGGGGGSLDIGTGWHALFGINVNDNFGAEAQYTAQGDVSGFNDVNDPERFSSWVASVSGVYRHTIYSALYFVAKLGAGYMNLEAHTFRNNNNGVNVTQDTKVHLGVLVYGAGLGVRFDQFGIRAMYVEHSFLSHLEIEAGDNLVFLSQDNVDLTAYWAFDS